MRHMKKIKVLGYPFAGGQGRNGVQNTPGWLNNQDWFKDMANNSNSKVPIEYEEIKVSSPEANMFHVNKHLNDGLIFSQEELDDAKNIKHVIASSQQLRNQTYQALKEGYYPIVLGGDHSQAIGSIA